MICIKRSLLDHNHNQYVFSSAPALVSGAYPMPSRQLSACYRRRPSIFLSTFFKNQIGSLGSYLISLIFAFNVHKNIPQKLVE